MRSTFFGLTIGASALNSYQAAVNTTANNLSNVQTKGYSRQNANMSATAALRVHARYGSTGTGVAVTSIRQERNLYYDTKYWENNSSLGYFERKLYYLDQIQDTFADDSVQTGFTTLFSTMFNSLDTIVSQGASDVNARNQFLNNAQSLCTYFNNLSSSLSDIQEDCNEEIRNYVSNINAIAEKISLLNKEINQIETGTGAEASNLRDERANLLDELSQIVDVETDEKPVKNSNDEGEDLGGTYFRVTINGQLLVDSSEYYALECVVKDTKNNQTDVGGLYSIIWSDTKMDFAATTESANGSLKALFAMRDGDNNDYLKGEVTVSEDLQSITMTDLSITDLNALNIPDSEGCLTIKNRDFKYDSWEAVRDSDGKITSITFNLSEPTTESIAYQMEGATGKCGSGVDAMGIPYYQAQINEFIRNFAEAFNDIERSGENLNGELADSVFVALDASRNPYDFYEYQQGVGEDEDEEAEVPDYDTISSIEGSYYRLTAKNFAINPDMLKDPALLAVATVVTNGQDAYDLIEQMKKLQSGVNMFRGDNASKFLETLISDISVDTQKSEIYHTNYSNLENSIGNQRTSISGVDEDEEALNLIKFQNAYNMASKVISVMSEMYDKLINETGV